MAYKENAAPPCCFFHILHLLALGPNLSQNFAMQPGLLGNLLVCLLVLCFSCQMERNQLAKYSLELPDVRIKRCLHFLCLRSFGENVSLLGFLLFLILYWALSKREKLQRKKTSVPANVKVATYYFQVSRCCHFETF